MRPIAIQYLLNTLSLLAIGYCLAGCGKESEQGYEPAPKIDESSYGQFIPTHRPERLEKIGPDACVECHSEEVAAWKRSHHAKANRLIDASVDRAAFTPARQIQESGVTYEMAESSGKFVLRVLQDDAPTVEYELTGVIGETPIRQYLAMLPGNKLQTISATYDVLNDRWLDVFEGQNRLPGEWGHWTGQGMNWNANCAYCHMTEYEKSYDFESDRYLSTWTQQGIACAECHQGLEAHVKAAQDGDYTTGLTALDRTQTEHNCASCHSRRDQLTADAFKPGDTYHDHFSLSLPDQYGLYHADGQILDEVFVYASFEMSRMGHAGVSCMDCHEPHSMEPILPIENNMLCMRCHEAGAMEAPIIVPVEHSFHGADSLGNRCVECHMPKTHYMQVDARADHGFHIPDPLLTREFGIPNACSNCHSDQDLDWAIEWSEKWYGEKLADAPKRKRARALTLAHAFAPEGVDALLALIEEEDIPAWKATYIGLLRNYMPSERAEAVLRAHLEDPTALIRERAVRSLSASENSMDLLVDRLNDSSRSVRIAATANLVLQNQDISDPEVAQEYKDYLNFNSDRPGSVFLLASKAANQGETEQVLTYVERAVTLDSLNPEVYRQASILLSIVGALDTAEQYLYNGWEIAPQNVIFPYSLGLLSAEQQDLETAISFLEEAVALQPDFYRAWYNLSIAYQQAGRNEDAARAMQKAQGM